MGFLKKRQKVKKKQNFIRGEKKTYFHFENGVVIRKNRLRMATINSVLMLLIGSGLFSGYYYGLPALQSTKYFQQEITRETAQPKPPKQITQTAIIDEDELLKFSLNQTIATFPNNQQWSVFAYDLNTEKLVNINEDASHDAASLYKLFLLESLEANVPYKKWAKTYIGQKNKKSVERCVESMLQVVDDPCGEDLAQLLGWDNINEFNKKAGYGGTKLDSTKGRKTTAKDTGELMLKLKRGHILSDSARRYIFDALYQQTYSKGIPVGCEACRAASKFGELSAASHNAAVVTHGPSSYVLVVMSEGGSSDQIAQLAKIVDERYKPAPAALP